MPPDREPARPAAPPARGRLSGLLAFGPPLLVGAVLRLWNLRAQVMSDDELHAVRAALVSPLRKILTTYFLVDNSIPLSALFRLLFDSGLRLSETAFRLPSLACGLALLALFPLWADRRLGRGTAIVFAWLLALSPSLVWYSRIARSYLPILLLGGCAAAAFWSWWQRPRPGMGAAYVLCAALAAWFHLGAGPFVTAAPFLFAAGELLLGRGRRGDRRRLELEQAQRRQGGGGPARSAASQAGTLRALALLAGATAAAFLLFLLPARESLLALIQDKHTPAPLRPRLVASVLELAAGTGHPLATALFWLAAAAGLLRLARSPRPEERRLAAYTATLAGVHVAGILVLSPVGLVYPLIFYRYLMIALPAVLLWVAAALGRPLSARTPAARSSATELAMSSRARGRDLGGGEAAQPPRSLPGVARTSALARDDVADDRDSSRRARDSGSRRSGSVAPPRRALRTAVAIAFLALLAASGPFPDPALRASPWAHDEDYMAFYTPRARLGPQGAPGAYRWLAASGGPGPVLEYPWVPMWRANRVFYLYQEVHGRQVVVAAPRPLLWDGRLAFRNLAPGNPEGFLASRARYLVVHRDLGREEDAVPEAFWPARPPIAPRFHQLFRRFGRGMGDRLTREWGPPDHADRRLRVWDLDRVRRERAPRRTGL